MSITLPFLAMLGLLFAFDEGGLLPYFLLACVIHELGHIACIYATGGRVGRITLSAVGANMNFSYGAFGGYGKELLCNGGGIAFNLLAALGFSGFPIFCGANLILGLFNLLPALPLDGGRLLQSLCSLWLGPFWGERMSHWVSGVTALCLCGFGVFVLIKSGYNISFLLVGLFLLVKAKARSAG